MNRKLVLSKELKMTLLALGTFIEEQVDTIVQ